MLANKNQVTRTHGAHVRRSPRLQHASRNDESPKTPTTESHRVRKPDSLQTPDHGKLGNKKTVKKAVNLNDFEPLSVDLDIDSPLGHWLEKYRQAKGEQSTRHKSENTFVGNTTKAMN